jgi:hypothetical protein
MPTRERNGGFAARPRNAKSWIGTPEPARIRNRGWEHLRGRARQDATLALRGRIKTTAFQCRQIVSAVTHASC